jgi:two-component system chemotaxis sensor kinase CheA
VDEFEQELKQGFLEEASQLVMETEQCFLVLESAPDDHGMLDKIFRLAHNLKGSAKAVGFDELGVFTHRVESLLLKLKNNEIKVDGSIVSLLLRCNDHIRLFLDSLKADLKASVNSDELLGCLDQAIQGGAPQVSVESSTSVFEDIPSADSPGFEEEMSSITETTLHTPEVVNPPTLNSTLSPTHETPVVAASTLVESAPSTPSKTAERQSDESIRVSLLRLERLLNFVGEMVILQTVLQEQSQSSQSQILKKTVHQLGKVTKEVQDISMSLRMVPLKQTFQKMQRIVRDTSSLLGKKVQLTLSGEETELDKTVLENLGDPLVHMIRNAVDHGIESPEKRQATGKLETGNVFLSAYHQGGKLIIEVRDDGGGIPGEVLYHKAIEKGILRAGTTMSDQEKVNLIFHPGFSTKTEVTEVSGRGVGMDVVKTNIEALQGEVQVSTVLGQGTTFKIILPLTLAIIDGMIITLHDDRFVIPLSHVHESLRPRPEDIQKTTGLGEVLLLRGENLPLYRLEALLGRKGTKDVSSNNGIAIVVRSQGRPFAVWVDDILGQNQIVIKKLGKELQNVRGLGGSAILGDGRPALILELADLIGKQTSKEPQLRRAA